MRYPIRITWPDGKTETRGMYKLRGLSRKIDGRFVRPSKMELGFDPQAVKPICERHRVISFLRRLPLTIEESALLWVIDEIKPGSFNSLLHRMRERLPRNRWVDVNGQQLDAVMRSHRPSNMDSVSSYERLKARKATKAVADYQRWRESQAGNVDLGPFMLVYESDSTTLVLSRGGSSVGLTPEETQSLGSLLIKRAADLERRQTNIANDTCPECQGELDTGWECNRCGFDAKPEMDRMANSIFQ